MTYWVAVVARNAAQHLPSTLESLIHQTLRPKKIIIVDDGSTDATPEILAHYLKKYPKLVSSVTLPNNGYDIRRVPRNINLAWKVAEANGIRTEYFMISGDDCSYPHNYASDLSAKMTSDPTIVVASGQLVPGTGIVREHVPSGSGRMIKCSFWRGIGGEYPVKAGWEAWLIFKALEEGLRVKSYDELTFEHKRPRGTRHQFVYWGAAMHSLGYHQVYAMGRIAKNAMLGSMSISGSISMLRGYIQACFGSEDAFISPFESSLRRFVFREQLEQIVNLAVDFGSVRVRTLSTFRGSI